MNKRKTKQLHIRLTPEDCSRLASRAERFQSISHFVMEALAEFSDSTAKDRQDAVRHLSDIYTSLDAKLAHIGGNLNQAMRQINQASAAGLPTTPLLVNSLLPLVRQCNDICIDIRKQLQSITLSHIKKKY